MDTCGDRDSKERVCENNIRIRQVPVLNHQIIPVVMRLYRNGGTHKLETSSFRTAFLGSSFCGSHSGGSSVHQRASNMIFSMFLKLRFNPIFLFPAVNDTPATAAVSSSPITNRTTGRKTGTGSANVTAPNRAATIRVPIVGYHQVSLLSAIRFTGLLPPIPQLGSSSPRSLDDIRSKADRPLVIFPECTTSNGRALLRFAECFPAQAVPVKGWKTFIMCVRCVLVNSAIRSVL